MPGGVRPGGEDGTEFWPLPAWFRQPSRHRRALQPGQARLPELPCDILKEASAQETISLSQFSGSRRVS